MRLVSLSLFAFASTVVACSGALTPESTGRRIDPQTENRNGTQRAESANLDAPSASTPIPSNPSAYDPCAGKKAGDSCTVCDPADPTCVETAVLKVCDAQGVCDAQAFPPPGSDGGAPSSAWLSFNPIQCGLNGWEALAAPVGSHLPAEAAKVVAFFASKGITLEEVGFVHPTEPTAVCLACSCPRGDRLVVKASGTGAAELVAHFGFVTLSNAYGLDPVQCGGNPWEKAPYSGQAAERADLASWLDANGATSLEVGFVDKAEPFATCAACSCPRGDTAVALPASDTARAAIGALGFAPLL